jgi:hypothetical protein
LSEALTDAKEASDKLKESIESYDTAVDNLNSCVKYTKEWYTALREANEEALALLDLDPSITFTKTEDGLLKISEASEEAAE